MRQFAGSEGGIRVELSISGAEFSQDCGGNLHAGCFKIKATGLLASIVAVSNWSAMAGLVLT